MNICKHFGDCGGCRFQDISYPEQLAEKERGLKGLLDEAGIQTELLPIHSAEPWYYRNKMEFCFGRNDDAVVLGLYSRLPRQAYGERGRITDIEECLIFSPDAAVILKAVKEFCNSRGHSVYNKYNYQGFLRHLVVRQAKFTNQTLVALVTTSQEQIDTDAFVKMLLALPLQSALASVSWIINDSYSDAVVCQQKRPLHGEPFIIEQLGDFRFSIGVDTFFQINPRLVVDFYNTIRERLSLSASERVMDLYCGSGTIGIFLAAQAKFVWGVEVSQDIVDLAWQNAQANNIDNISFLCADARQFLNTQAVFYRGIDVLVVNPPRSGLSNKIIRSILRLEPQRIFYSSCNPQALVRDVVNLGIAYQPCFVEPFDFFPHTPHLEACTLLVRK